MNARQAAKAASIRIEELENTGKKAAADIKTYNEVILGMIEGKSPCDWCEDQQECRDAGKTEIAGCDDWMLRSQPVGGDGVDGEGVFQTGPDSGTGAETNQCQTTPLS